jgi:hypothetical protein
MHFRGRVTVEEMRVSNIGICLIRGAEVESEVKVMRKLREPTRKGDFPLPFRPNIWISYRGDGRMLEI